jgi:hypothetical protein
VVRSQPRQIVCETLSRKTHHKKIGLAQGESPEFKPQYHKKKKKKEKTETQLNPPVEGRRGEELKSRL